MSTQHCKSIYWLTETHQCLLMEGHEGDHIHGSMFWENTTQVKNEQAAL